MSSSTTNTCRLRHYQRTRNSLFSLHRLAPAPAHTITDADLTQIEARDTIFSLLAKRLAHIADKLQALLYKGCHFMLLISHLHPIAVVVGIEYY